MQQALSRNKDTTATAQLKGVLPDFYPSQSDLILSKCPLSSTSTPLHPYIYPCPRSLSEFQPPIAAYGGVFTGFLAFVLTQFARGGNHGIPEPSWCARGLATSPWYPITCKSEGLVLLKSPVFVLSFSFP